MTTRFEPARNGPGTYRDLTPREVHALGDAPRLVDVREPDEYTGELGHVRGAALVPLATLESAARRWRKEDAIVVICRSGGRSGRAAAMLAAMGFHRVSNMAGGMLAWHEARLPIDTG